MPTLANGYDAALVKKRYYRRSNMIKKKSGLPRKEKECIRYVGNFLNREEGKYKAKFRIKKDTEEHFIPEKGKCVISDAVIYDVYKTKQKDIWIDKFRRVISIEFEEHLQNYSILESVSKCPAIHVPSRKLHYFRPFDAQYWIKIDMDGTPICIPYQYIARNHESLNDIGAQGKFTSKYQREMIMAAARDEDGKFPSYVLTGWRAIFKEFRRILTAYDTKKPVKLIV